MHENEEAIYFIVLKGHALFGWFDLSHQLQDPVGDEGHTLHVADLTIVVRVGIEHIEEGLVICIQCTTVFL